MVRVNDKTAVTASQWPKIPMYQAGVKKRKFVNYYFLALKFPQKNKTVSKGCRDIIQVRLKAFTLLVANLVQTLCNQFYHNQLRFV